MKPCFSSFAMYLATSRATFCCDLLTCTCVGIHPGRVEPIELTTSRTEALQARRSFATSIETFTPTFLHRAWPKTHGSERGSRSALIVVANVFSWPPLRLHHLRGGVGSRSLVSSPSGRLAAGPNALISWLALPLAFSIEASVRTCLGCFLAW